MVVAVVAATVFVVHWVGGSVVSVHKRRRWLLGRLQWCVGSSLSSATTPTSTTTSVTTSTGGTITSVGSCCSFHLRRQQGVA